jgi:putative ABC transport system substrate-binding protein
MAQHLEVDKALAGRTVRRRAFAAWVATCAALPVRAQGVPSGTAMPRIAWVSGARPDARAPFFGALRLGLAETGRVEGRDFRLDAWWGDDSMERFDGIVAEVLRSRPDLIVTQGPIILAVQRSLTPLPIVFAYSGDPVEAGLVGSLPRPGRNLTGISMMSLELVGKRMQAMAEAIPGLRRLALITNPGHAGERRELAASQAAASTLGLEVEYLPFRGDAGLDGALQGALRARCEGIVVFPDGGMMLRSERFAAFAIEHRMPATSGWAEFARRGNLMSYGPNLQQVFRRLGWYVDRVLKGAKPSELPVELPTTIEHVVNLRTARAMGLAIPRSVLLGADEVIE